MFTRPDIQFATRFVAPRELEYCREALKALNGDTFGAKSRALLRELTQSDDEPLLTASATAALELVGLACGLQAGDEFIVPSYTFVSSAAAFARTGAAPVFVDVDPVSLSCTPDAVRSAITARTKLVVVVHYAGWACVEHLRQLRTLCDERGLVLVEDAAHCAGAVVDGLHLGTIGDFGVLSFHHTKNLACGEGGALFVNRARWRDAALVALRNGTNREAFLSGLVPHYEWCALGSSFALGELPAALLAAQLECVRHITETRARICAAYRQRLAPHELTGALVLPPTSTNGHIFFVRLMRGEGERDAMQAFMRQHGVQCNTHYAPLHRSPFGSRARVAVVADSVFPGSEIAARQTLRLPVHCALTDADVERVCELISQFFLDRD